MFYWQKFFANKNFQKLSGKTIKEMDRLIAAWNLALEKDHDPANGLGQV